jgi:hypothetical protein
LQTKPGPASASRSFVRQRLENLADTRLAKMSFQKNVKTQKNRFSSGKILTNRFWVLKKPQRWCLWAGFNAKNPDPV